MRQQVKAKWWQWPNILSIDAALVAVTWQWIFAESAGASLSSACTWVLGASVWLTYMADRLFDVRRRDNEQLLSHRHQFAKAHQPILWLVWSVLLVSVVLIAFTGLNTRQLLQGFVLLAACLTYTFLNQRLSKRFFPKEILVAVIFAGGVVIFIETNFSLIAITSFTAICLLNCLSLGINERAIDEALKVHSLSAHFSPAKLCGLCTLSLCALPFMALTMAWSLGLVSVALLLLLKWQKHFDTEAFRVAIDTSMLLGIIPWIFR
jgi:hypothetical protein